MRKKIVFLFVLMLLGVFGYNYLYQDHRNISSEKPDFVVDSNNIVSEFSSEPDENEQKYIDKTIQVTGVVTEINESDLTLDDAVFCQFNSDAISSVEIGKKIAVKGRCIGFDDLLEQIKLNECSIIE